MCGACSPGAWRVRARPRTRAARGGGRQQPLHRGRHALRLRRGRRSQGADAGPHRGRDRADGLRHLHRGPVLRRHVSRHRVSHRSRSHRDPGQAEPRDAALDALQGRPLRADLGTAGVQGRRPVQVLGRPHRREPRRGSRPRQLPDRGGREERHHHSLRHARRRAGRGRRRRAGAARPARGQDRHDQDPQRRARRGRLPGQRRMAHALHGAGLGARQGARHPLQHRRRHQDGARRQRHADGQLVGRPRGRLGPQRAGVRRPLGRRQLPEAQLPVLPS